MPALLDAERPPDANEAERVATARRHFARARSSILVGKLELAASAIAAAGVELEGVRYEPVRAEYELNQGLLDRQRRDDRAERSLERAVELAMRSGGRELQFWAVSSLMEGRASALQRPADARALQDVAAGLAVGSKRNEGRYHRLLAQMAHLEGDIEGAVEESRRSLALHIAASGAQAVETIQTHGELAFNLLRLGKFDVALAEQRVVVSDSRALFGDDHPITATMRHNLASMMLETGDTEGAEAEFRLTLDAFEAWFGPDHMNAVMGHGNLCSLLPRRGKNDEALIHCRQALEGKLRVHGEDGPEVARARINLALLHTRTGEYDQALSALQAARESLVASLGGDHPDVAQAFMNIGFALRSMGRLEEGLAAYRESMDIYTRAFGADNPRTLRVRQAVADMLRILGRPAEAETEYRAALVRTASEDDTPLAEVRAGLGNALLDRGEVDEARLLLRQAWAALEHADIERPRRAPAAFGLARALSKDPEQALRARELAGIAKDWLTAAGPAYARDALEVTTWLADLR